MNKAISAAHIHQNILQDTQSCEALLTLLNEERDALRDRNMEALERILTAKSGHLESLEHSANERSKLAQSFSGASDQQNWRELIARLGDEKLNESWLKLKNLLRSCKLENEVNGKLLSRNHQIYARLLEIVRGQTQAPSLYNARGSSSTGASSNVVGEA